VKPSAVDNGDTWRDRDRVCVCVWRLCIVVQLRWWRTACHAWRMKVPAAAASVCVWVGGCACGGGPAVFCDDDDDDGSDTLLRVTCRVSRARPVILRPPPPAAQRNRSSPPQRCAVHRIYKNTALLSVLFSINFIHQAVDKYNESFNQFIYIRPHGFISQKKEKTRK